MSPEQNPEVQKINPESYEPKFGFTQNMTKKFQEKGIDRQYYEEFTPNLDKFLEKASTFDGLISIGLVIVPGSEGLASYVVSQDSVVVDIVSYWTAEVSNEIGSNYRQLDDEIFNFPINSNYNVPDFFWHEGVSIKDYPTIEKLVSTLDDPKERWKFTASGSAENFKCEFWGMVTTEELRQELQNKQ